MVALIRGTQPCLEDVCVYLRGRNTTMAKHLLHDTQVGSPVEQMGGKGVPQRMRRDRLRDPCLARISPQQFPKPLTGHGPIAAIDEHLHAMTSTHELGSWPSQIGPQAFRCLVAQRHEPLYATFAKDLEPPLGQMQRPQGQGNQLRDPQPCGIEHFEHGGIATAPRGIQSGLSQQAIHLLDTEDVWQSWRHSRRVDIAQRIAPQHPLLPEVTAKRSQAGEPSRQRAGRESIVPTVCQKPKERRTGERFCHLDMAPLPRSLQPCTHIPPIGTLGVQRQAPLDPQILGKLSNPVLYGLFHPLVTAPSITDCPPLDQLQQEFCLCQF